MKIGKLNVLLNVTSSLNERQYINVLTIIKEGYEEEIKLLKKKYHNIIFASKDKLDKDTRRIIISKFKSEKSKLKRKYFPSYAKAKVLRYGKEALKKVGKYKKPIIATAATAAVVGGLAAYSSKKRHDAAKKRLGIN
jgi:hypothetical protein